MNKLNLLFIFFFAFLFSLFNNVFSQQKIIDSFNNISSWEKVFSDGVDFSIHQDSGYKGKSLRIDYKFNGAGWCGIEKSFPLNLPSNYKFSFYVKGDSPNNNLEFKLIDSTGNNVWWLNQRNFEFPNNWQKVVIRKRDIQFAWGPIGGGELKKIKNIQIIISASQGGSGSVYLDDLKFEKINPPQNPNAKPTISASSTKAGIVENLIDNNLNTSWQSSSKPQKQFLLIDQQFKKEFGGLVIIWDSLKFAKDFNIELSNNRVEWEKVYSNKNNNKNNSFIFIKNGEARYIKINLKKSNEVGYSIKEIKIKKPEFSQTYNNFFESVASYFPRGYFPKYFHNEQSYWTIIGASEDQKEALINEEGAVEVDKASFRIEPNLFTDNKLITWNNVKLSQSLEKNYLPIPSVNWNYKNLQLNIKAFAFGEAGKSNIFIRYRIKNNSDQNKKGNLFLAIRPFQVNPPWQFLNIVGGTSKIKNISAQNNFIKVDDKTIFPLLRPNNFGASTFSEGEIIEYISKDSLPILKTVEDNFSFASGALKYSFDVKPNSTQDYYLIIPFYKKSYQTKTYLNELESKKLFEEKLNSTINFWEKKIDRVKFKLPHSADKLINTLKSNLAYILINKDGPAIQPGSRSYERAWIRDGALTSSALLRMGITKEVKDYLDWYSKYQYPNGKIPCVVDKRGADPTPENDSHGEYIYAILQYFRFTKDTSFLKNKLKNITGAVNYIEFLTNQRKTAQYKKEDSLAFYGLMPESISHEGYSAKPMHSYWDDFFTLRGLRDAVTITEILNENKLQTRFTKLRDEFEKNLYNSINLAMKNHNINYIPGSVELGDFDATSTTIAIYPGKEMKNLPHKQLMNTFEKYYENFKKRLNPDYKWDAYTPYEIRVAGTFLYLGKKEKTFELLKFFFSDQRPTEWNDWAEVVWKNKNEPKFIGDMPHTWIGSDYINVVRAMFGYENELDTTLVLAAGIKDEWLDDPKGISVKDFPTYYGNLSYNIIINQNKIKMKLTGNISLPKNKIIIKSPIEKTIKSVTINGKAWDNFNEKEIYLDNINSDILISY